MPKRVLVHCMEYCAWDLVPWRGGGLHDTWQCPVCHCYNMVEVSARQSLRGEVWATLCELVGLIMRGE